jgi:hypothetical protein
MLQSVAQVVHLVRPADAIAMLVTHAAIAEGEWTEPEECGCVRLAEQLRSRPAAINGNAQGELAAQWGSDDEGKGAAMTDEDRPTFAQLALQAEEALQEVARLTLWGAGNEPISEGLYRTIRDLAAAARHTGEITTNVSKGLEKRVGLDRLRLDGHGEERYVTPGAAVAATQVALAEATAAAKTMAEALAEAQNIASTIADTGNLPDDD